MSKASSIDHVFHVWINQRQMQRYEAGLEHEHSLYEWKSALAEMKRLPTWLKAARMSTLRTVHQQCSHSAPQAINGNRLYCAIGTDVTECDTLKSLYATFAEEGKREFYKDITPDDVDEVAAKVCCWHIFMQVMDKRFAIDTSEGYVKDEGDRMFWNTVYEHLSAECAEDDEEV